MNSLRTIYFLFSLVLKGIFIHSLQTELPNATVVYIQLTLHKVYKTYDTNMLGASKKQQHIIYHFSFRGRTLITLTR